MSTGGKGARWATILVVAHLVFAALWSVTVPLGEAPDEADHWAYITYLAREHRLPQGPELTQSKHPPLFHATAALLAGLIVPGFGRLDSRLFLRANPDVSFRPEDVGAGTHAYNSFIHTTYEDWPWRPGPLAYHVARFWAVVLSTLTVWATYRFLRLAFPGQEDVALAATGLLAFLPEFAFIGGVLNNDNAAAFLGTAALWGGMAMYRSRNERFPGWWTPFALGLGIWAKVSTAALWPAVALLVFLSGGRSTPKAGLKRLGVVFVPALALAAPWFVRNWRLYGDPMGWALVRATVDVRTAPWTWADTVWLIKGWFLSFWGKFGSAGHIPMAKSVYVVLGGMTMLALLGLVRGLARGVGRRNGKPMSAPAARFVDVWSMGALFLAVVGVAFAMWRYSLVALGTDQARLLFPAIAPLVGLLAFGWLALGGASWRRTVSSWVVVGSLALGIYALMGVVRPAYAPPPTVPASEWARLPRVVPVDFGEISLVAWNLEEEPVLYWLARERPRDDIRVVLRVTAEDGTLVWEWKRSPGAGRWSTDHWPRGYVMRDAYRVRWPDWGGPGRYRVEVGAYEFLGDVIVPLRAQEPVATLEHPYVMLGWLQKP